MKLNPVGSNQTEVEKPDGSTVLFSYQTPVAVFVPGRGALVTEHKWSRTTSKHIGLAVNRWGCSRTVVPQSEIDALAEGKAAHESDARLIAAAPDLLEELLNQVKNINGDIEAHLENGETERDVAFLVSRRDSMLAAIAKATGRSA